MTRVTSGALAILVVMIFGVSLNAQTLDGSLVGDSYGSAAAVQTVQTGFGDNFSELNAAYGRASVADGMLRLLFTGNLENNFAKLNIFIDSRAGGENTITPDTSNGGNNPTNDGWATRYTGVGTPLFGDPITPGVALGPGFTFDTGFNADYLIIARNGFDGSNKFDLDFNSVGNASVAESSMSIFGDAQTGINNSVGPTGIGVAFDNSNAAGILAGTGAVNTAEALAVQTGLELFVPLSAIGNPGLGDTILISAHINSSNHDYLSNQFLGGMMAGQGNLGDDGGGGFTKKQLSDINLNQFAGDQFFGIVVVPEPSSVVLLAWMGLSMLHRRRVR